MTVIIRPPTQHSNSTPALGKQRSVHKKENRKKKKLYIVHLMLKILLCKKVCQRKKEKRRSKWSPTRRDERANVSLVLKRTVSAVTQNLDVPLLHRPRSIFRFFFRYSSDGFWLACVIDPMAVDGVSESGSFKKNKNKRQMRNYYIDAATRRHDINQWAGGGGGGGLGVYSGWWCPHHANRSTPYRAMSWMTDR
jgi:hypothetical protein